MDGNEEPGEMDVPCAFPQIFPDNAYNIVLTAIYGHHPVEPPTKVCDFICDS